MIKTQINKNLKFTSPFSSDKQKENMVVETYALRGRLLSPTTMYRINDTQIVVNAEGGSLKSGHLPYKANAKAKDLVNVTNLWEKFGKKKSTASLSEVGKHLQSQGNLFCNLRSLKY